jgi:DNA-binding LytR/AlgR family response regulator
MKAVIVEDEKLIAADLGRMLNRCCPDIEIVATLNSLKTAVEWFNTQPTPDLVFMDIQLSDGTSFEIFEKTTLQCPVIFTTAYNEYAIRAFKVNSVDYLLKPIDEEELKRAVEKYRKIYQLNGNVAPIQEQLQALVSQIYPAAEKFKERFIVHYKNTLMPIATNQIALFVRDELVFAYTIDGERYIPDHYNSLDEIEAELDPQQFFRANRQAIINIDAIENYRSDYTGKLHIKLKTSQFPETDISRDKAPIFKKWVG